MPAGYSGKPLAAKLDLKEGHRVLLVDAPPDFRATLGDVPDGVKLLRTSRGEVDVAHLFVKQRKRLAEKAPLLQQQVSEGGHLWVSWPKRSSGVETDITEDTLRDVLLPTGWVDTKVCAVDETWSGLKFMRRRKPSDKPGRPTAREVAERRDGPKAPARGSKGTRPSTQRAAASRRAATGGRSSGSRAPKNRAAAVRIPADLRLALSQDRAAKEAFDAMPPSHRRRYVEHVDEAVRPETRKRRIGSSLRMMKDWGRRRKT